MKRLLNLVIIFFLASAMQVYAESPSEQFQQVVEQLQKSPNDDALRERVIKLSREMNPVPAIPEDARRSFVRGNTALSDAKGGGDYARAVQRYQEAITVAPWWGDPYFNLSKAQELQQDYNGAAHSLKFFLLTGPVADEARKAQDYIYVLEDKRDKLLNEKANQQAAAEKKAQAQRLLENFRGTWYGRACYVGFSADAMNRGCTENEANGIHWHLFRDLEDGRPNPLSFEFPNDGSVKLNSYSAWAGCGDVFGIPQGPSFEDIRWEERSKDGQARQVYVDISNDGNWLRVSCNRPISGANPNNAYRYVTWSRNPK